MQLDEARALGASAKGAVLTIAEKGRAGHARYVGQCQWPGARPPAGECLSILKRSAGPSDFRFRLCEGGVGVLDTPRARVPLSAQHRVMAALCPGTQQSRSPPPITPVSGPVQSPGSPRVCAQPARTSGTRDAGGRELRVAMRGVQVRSTSRRVWRFIY